MTADPSKISASNQQERVRRKIIAAVLTIKSEILAQYDPSTGLYRYNKNSGRVSEAEVLRRAGGIDKNTLKRSYHYKSRATVRRLLNWADRKCNCDRQEPGPVENEATPQAQIAILTELLGAAEARMDIAELAAESAIRHEQAASEKILALEVEVRRLREIIVQQMRSVGPSDFG